MLKLDENTVVSPITSLATEAVGPTIIVGPMICAAMDGCRSKEKQRNEKKQQYLERTINLIPVRLWK